MGDISGGRRRPVVLAFLCAFLLAGAQGGTQQQLEQQREAAIVARKQVLAGLEEQSSDARAVVDSLSGLWLLGLTAEFEVAVAWVASQSAVALAGSRVDVASTVASVLGGLASAHALSGDGRLLKKSVEVARRLMPALTAPRLSGMPARTIADLQHGVLALQDDEEHELSLAEFYEVARASGLADIAEAADRAFIEEAETASLDGCDDDVEALFVLRHRDRLASLVLRRALSGAREAKIAFAGLEGALEGWIWTAGGHPLPPASGQGALTGAPASFEEEAFLVADVVSTGRVSVLASEEPAFVVEAFARVAREEGHVVTFDDVLRILDFFCSRRQCVDSFKDTAQVDLGFFGSSLMLHQQENPVVAVSRFYRRAIERGQPMTRASFRSMLEAVCTCLRDGICVWAGKNFAVPSRTTVAVPPFGFLTVEAWEEPSSVVERLGRHLAARGSKIEGERLEALFEWFCLSRDCHRPLPKKLSLNLLTNDSTVILDCEPWEPPEFALERFGGGPGGLMLDDLNHRRALDWLCDRRDCGLGLHIPLTLTVWAVKNDSVGEVYCGALEDPADCVERFVSKSLGWSKKEASWAQVLGDDAELLESMSQMMEWLCSRRHCSRAIAERIEGTLSVSPWTSPHTALAAHARAREQAGEPLSEAEERELYLELCRERWRCEELPPHMVLTVVDTKNVTCRSWQEPADVVESFAANNTVTPESAERMLELICAERECRRRKLGPPLARQLVMHPGKTAGRAIATALAETKSVFVLGHDSRCGDGQQCHVVLREPTERFVSALAFKKQGGEGRAERLLGNLCHHWLRTLHIDEIDLSNLNSQCGFNDAQPSLSTHSVFRPLSWWVNNQPSLNFLCYSTLNADFQAAFAEDCPKCHLKRQNPSNHTAILGKSWNATALREFVEYYYADDLELYARHCL